MPRKHLGKEAAFIFIYLVVLASVLLVSRVFPSVTVSKILVSLSVLVVLHVIFRIGLRHALYRVKDERLRYHLRRVTSMTHWIAAGLSILHVWVPDPSSLFVAYGIVGAGIAIALQEPLKNAAGGISIYLSAPFTVGDRIEIDGLVGDVMDIGITRTTLMEIRDWVVSDQATGRLVMMPNGKVFAEPIKNYTKDHDFVWDELRVPITYDSDWKRAAEELRKICEEETAESVQGAKKALSALGTKYYFSGRRVDPAVYITFNDNWVLLSLRYVTNVRGRRDKTSQISVRILDLIRDAHDITISSENSVISISDVPAVEIKSDKVAA